MTDVPEDSVHPLSRKAWREWLRRQHARSTGVWLIAYKQGTGKPRFSYDEAVEEALCFGWIDSKPRKLDDERSMLWFSPRKPRTGWSKLNQQRVERLLAAGLMQPAGLAKIEAARADGSWNKLNEVEALVIPPDLVAALDRLPPARQYFEAFPKSVRRGILEWILNAKRSETRAKRIEETATLAAKNERANQWRPAQ